MLKDLFLLDPQVIYLNHGSFGACPRRVFEKYQECQRQLERQPVQFLGVELDRNLQEARKALGDYLHASFNDLVFVTNATHGVNIVARSLRLKPGDEILTTNHEYGACNFAWDFVCQKTGAIYKQQAITTPFESEEEIVEQFWNGVTPRTRVIFISHITSPTSVTLSVQKICQRARQAGILTVIDGAHAPGQIPLNLPELQADFYTGNCHKWMLSPKGAGVLYAQKDVQYLVEPLVVSWGYSSNTSTPKESRFVDLLQWTGTYDPAAALSVPVAIDFMRAHHWDRVQADCHQLLRSAMRQIGEYTGLPPLYSIDSDLYHQMGTMPLPRIKDLVDLKDRLYNEHRIEIPCINWNDQHFLRLSVQGYNTEEDMEKLLEALYELIPQMKV